MKITQKQLNIIANTINTFSDSAESAGAYKMAFRLFPESRFEIDKAIENHPIRQKWHEYRVAKAEERKKFLLPEE